MTPSTVIKVGGSLYEWNHLRFALGQFIQQFDKARIFIVPGGGHIVDLIRQLDQTHQLGEETSHWLALGALSNNAHFLCRLLDDVSVIGHSEEVRNANGKWILDVARFARVDDTNALHLPHTWDSTSDAFAARVAEVANAKNVILLKSTDPPSGTIEQWSATGFVDALFPQIARRAEINVSCVNLLKYTV